MGRLSRPINTGINLSNGAYVNYCPFMQVTFDVIQASKSNFQQHACMQLIIILVIIYT